MSSTRPDLVGVGSFHWPSTAIYRFNATSTTNEITNGNLNSDELIYSYTDPNDPNDTSFPTWPEHDIKVNTISNVWSDFGNGAPTDPFVTDSNGDIELENTSISLVLFRFTPPAASTWSGSGSGSGSTYPPPRTNRFLNAAIYGVAWAWNTYQVFQTASGGNPIGGPGGGGWLYDLLQGETANEVTAEIEVDANNPDGGNVSPGDELYIEWDDDHNDESETPNMTITTEDTDLSGTTTNPSNTDDNVATAGSSGSNVLVKIVCVKKPTGLVKLYIKEPDPNNEGIADTLVGEVKFISKRRPSSNFW